jgi:hypothetical protein
MIDPISTGIAFGGFALSLWGANQQKKQMERNARYNASLTRAQIEEIRRNDSLEDIRQLQDLNAMNKMLEKNSATVKASFANNGIVSSSGSAQTFQNRLRNDDTSIRNNIITTRALNKDGVIRKTQSMERQAQAGIYNASNVGNARMTQSIIQGGLGLAQTYSKMGNYR